MPSHKDGNPNPDLVWRTLTDFTLSTAGGSEREALERVAGAMLALRLSSTRLEDLKATVAQAMREAIDCCHRSYAELRVRVQVGALDVQRARVVAATDRKGRRFAAARAPDLRVEVDSQDLPRGWGFFLVEKMTDDLDRGDGEVRRTVDLFIYPDGD